MDIKAIAAEEISSYSRAVARSRANHAFATSTPYLAAVGLLFTLAVWYLLCEFFKVPYFNDLPGPCAVAREWFSRNPKFGVSIYTPEYYQHIYRSTWRVLQAFLLATALGVPLGLFMGWNKTFRDYTFPVIKLVRLIPMFAWVPLAVLMFPGREGSLIYVSFLGAFFATTLNTLLGVESIDEAYLRAARCLGSSSRQVFFRIILPGALPSIFTGLQISMGYSWFCLVAGEMIAGEYGLGYLIWTSYITVAAPVLVIAMVTLGFLGWAGSAAIRLIGRRLMRWQVTGMAQ
jgi:NitT/TauT family transport system permease protein